jgi:hypothetical protein
MLWGLPEELTYTVVLTWAGAGGVGRLDSATCNKISRALFLRLLRAPGFALPKLREQRKVNYKRSTERTNQLMAWVVKRDVAVTELAVTESFTMDHNGRIAYLHRHGEQVKSVTVQRTIASGYSTAEVVVCVLCAYCPNVLTLDLGIEISDETRSLIAQRWKKLTSLQLKIESDDGSSDEESSVYESGWGLVEICENCQGLVELTVGGEISAPLIRTMLQVCSRQLEVLAIDDTSLRASDFEIIASRCPHLRELHVDSNSVGDAELHVLGAGCPKLGYVSTKLVTDAGLLAVARNRSLTSLDVSCNRNVSEPGICSVAACSPLLKDINLRGCDHLTDAALTAIAENCPLLERLTLMWCSPLTDIALIAIGQHCHHLRDLDLSETRVTHMGLAAIAAGCPLLESLSADQCSEVGPALEAIARGCPRLRHVSARRVGVPAAAVLALAECCPMLETAYFQHSKAIGDEEIAAVVRGCPHLRVLDVEHTSVSERGLRAIPEHCRVLSCIVSDACGRPDHISGGESGSAVCLGTVFLLGVFLFVAFYQCPGRNRISP